MQYTRKPQFSVKTAALLGMATLAALGLTAAAPQAARAQIVSGFNANSLGPSDDGSTGAVSLGFTDNFYGTSYNSVYVNNNGNVTFTAPLSSFTPDALSTAGHAPIIAPFFADVDTRYHGSPVTYGTGTYDGHNAFGVNYLNVGHYGDTSASSTLVDNFQVILVDRSDIAAGDSDIFFNYGSMGWDTGTASNGVSADVGYTNGTGVAGTYFEAPGSRVTGAFLNGGADALNGRTLSFQVRSGTVSSVLATPEPSSVAAFALTGLGAAGLMLKARKRRASAA